MAINNTSLNYIASMIEILNVELPAGESIFSQVGALLEVGQNYFIDSDITEEDRLNYLKGNYSPQGAPTPAHQAILEDYGAKILLEITGNHLYYSPGVKQDEYSMAAINSCLKAWLEVLIVDETITDLFSAKLKEVYSYDVSFSSIDEVIDYFIKNNHIVNEEVSREVFCRFAKNRIDLWSANYIKTLSLDYDQILIEEKNLASENEVDTGIGNPISQDLEASGILNISLLGQRLYPYDDASIDPTLPFLQRASRNKVGEVDKNAFFRVFSNVNQSIVKTESEGGIFRYQLADLFTKLESIGFFELAGYAGEISSFARKRTANKMTIQRSASEFIDPVTDTPWLLRVNEVTGKLKLDPILFASIIYYFPSWTTFLLDTIAVLGDYSNGGLGGGLEDDVNNPAAFIESLEKAFGMGENGEAIFRLASTISNTVKKLQNALEANPFRENTAPANPDIFHLRIGAANFYVPPVSIDVNSAFKAGSLMPGAIRQKNSPKFNAGYKETVIRMRLFFPNYEEIWGLSIDDGSSINLNDEFTINFKANGDSDKKIDKFLSSLRGLVAAFKYSPFVPVKNHYLNAVHGISGVGFSNMTISTIPNFPFALAVDLELVNFNHKPFLPMLNDFNQAVHWGKYRQYMGKAAGQLNRYINEQFLLKSSDNKIYDDSGFEDLPTIVSGPADVHDAIYTTNPTNQFADVHDSFYATNPADTFADVHDALYTSAVENQTTSSAANQNTSSNSGRENPYDYDILKTNIIEQWSDGNNITFYAPAEAQTKIFLPSVNSFRSDEEKLMTDLGSNAWNSILKKLKIDIDENDSYGIPLADVIDISKEGSFSKSTNKIILEAIDIITAGINTQYDQEKIYDYFITNFIIENNLTPKPGSSGYEDQKEVYDWLKDRDAIFLDGSNVQGTYYFQGQYLSDVSLSGIKRTFINISQDPREFLDFLVETKIADAKYKYGGDYNLDEQKTREEIVKAFNVSLYERFFKSGPIQNLMEAARARAGAYQFNEWEVPMLRVDLNPEYVIVNGVTVSLGNNLVKLQIQMQDEPTYQHIGGKDSYINISMTVIGEQELIKIKNIFDHISGLARLEHASGVIGFLGIKNIITALAGIKYVMPLNYRVSTRPNFPHIYDVELTLIDFDIFQQKREQLSSKQQRDLIEHFGSKRNPFLRIKQLWGSFNAYPDFPLDVKDDEGATIGCLDPDFYFRSFEMFDRDVVNNITYQTPRVEEFIFEDETTVADVGLVAEVSNKILEFLRVYTSNLIFNGYEFRPSTNPAEFVHIEGEVLNNLLKDMVDYLKSNNISKKKFVEIYYSLLDINTTEFSREFKVNLLTDFLSFNEYTNENSPYLTDEINPSPFVQGNVSPNDLNALNSLQAALDGQYSLANDVDENGKILVSFDPDSVDFHKQIFMIPAASEDDLRSGQIPSIMQCALGTYYGYSNKNNGRFYLTAGGDNVTIDPSSNSYKFSPNPIEDTQTPDRGTTNSLTGVAGVAALSDYQKPYKQSSGTHWETMMVDTSYRDISGRMVRAFPTYMLWLIDEGGYFAGAKLFDNFYGLQSIIDFSVVTSEDLLGDTLIFRVSNLYSKLTKKESSSLFSVEDDYNTDSLSLAEGLGGIIDRTLNMSRNIVSGMQNEYVVDIANIRLKPGVRVHLRVGYGSNPNSLQTVFNGVITNVEQGEIVTVTAQSDAIELGAVINSTNKKGDSGKIDGGIDTGMYLSEPRDLMVRLLSMGTSRTREALAHATRGTVFSENKFGIRHFGTIIYEPLNQDERIKNDAIRSNVAAAFDAIGGSKTSESYTANFRDPSVLNMVGQLWANFSADVDFEIFKRNIYPGNGLGIAQFLGGDIDDGWSTVASISTEDTYNDRIEGYLGRLTDMSFNNLLQNYQQESKDAKEALDYITANNKLIKSGRAGQVKAGLGVAGAVAGIAIASTAFPVIGTAVAGASLLGLISGRGGTNLFRTMGLISPNDDDDLPGYDEVSFRAQTYMRTVWDIFQVCARLLPNYIVAVRPFEDRSTVFYGKPHWLYTSGVVPVTTGFPSEERARELGISSGPAKKGPDQVLNTLLDNLNKNTNPLADYGAYFQGFETNDTFREVADQIVNSSGIYAPSKFLAGKILDFYSTSAVNHYDLETKGITSKIPISKGIVGMGPHLPVITKEMLSKGENISTIQSSLKDQEKIGHSQISQLPPRYGFPYYTVSEELVQKNSSNIQLSASFYPYANQDDVENIYYINNYNNLNEISRLELEFFKETNLSIAPNIGNDSAAINYDQPIDFKSLYQDVEGSFRLSTSTIIMPIPVKKQSLSESMIDDSYSFEYFQENRDLNYSEWGAPETKEDEQFYIAMRWPYEPSVDDEKLIELFKTTYGISQVYGTADDYKNRKVLVYNPSNNRAVVCKPAYFLWGEDDQELVGTGEKWEEADFASKIDARVSPDAAFFLGLLTYDKSLLQEISGDGGGALDDSSLYEALELPGNADGGWGTDGNDFGNEELNFIFAQVRSGYAFAPRPRECLFAFVPDSIPVGVLSESVAPVNTFKVVDSTGQLVTPEDSAAYRVANGGPPEEMLDSVVGFGQFKTTGDSQDLYANFNPYDGSGMSADRLERLVFSNDSLRWYKPYDAEYVKVIDVLAYAGNPLNIDGSSYFKAVVEADYDKISADKLNEIKNGEAESDANRVSFVQVWDPADLVSLQARSYFDESYDSTISVIAGNGRTNDEAQQIWDQFRAEYHTYDSVKRIFFDIYGLDADNESEFPEIFKRALTGNDFPNDIIQKYMYSEDSALDEFGILLGSDYYSSLSNESERLRTDAPGDYAEAVEFMRENFIDANFDQGGLIEYYNNIINKSFSAIKRNFFTGENIGDALKFSLDAETDSSMSDQEVTNLIAEKITTPKQLFLLMVGIFRQRMWEDPYSRAWLVLKPDKKPGWWGSTGWSFKPVDPIFRAFINPYQDYAKPSKKADFLKLLVSTKSEGNGSSTYWSEAVDGTEDFVSRTIGPITTAVSDALSGLAMMFKTSMQQLGYALSEVGNFKRQANILNKALNDSIYYSLGRPESMLRAVDNPFTREYGEPVVEIREPFQRLHYISSFSHIISNQIQENLNNVATTITAVSDGKYPVTVALDKGAPAERQVEKTIETGIIYDNIVGSGFLGLTGIVHPLMHPLETIRGVAKNIQGTPDELSSRRIALAHLKESIKDIYGGELIVIGNADIRPHDLVYLSDVYERMYGIFEVEQVVHHFTPELGYITSITPNALVTVNDPARWFMTSWMQSWMHIQNVRNDARIYLDNIRNANAGLFTGGSVSVDKLSEMLGTQIVGGFQFTHGSTALVKDIMANQAATSAPGIHESLLNEKANEQGGVPTFALASSVVPVIGPLVWKGWKWIRDNVLDQHGCYVQYLNKNGQPMDAGLSYNQGMVVGQHHSTKLLPGILGVREKTRSPEGNSYIRSDDLLRSLGWNETEITQLVKHISYESALVHARVANLAGLGPEKTSFEWKFKVICKVTDVLDGDTINVQDIISGNSFRIRFDGINTAETNVLEGKLDYPETTTGSSSETTVELLDLNTPAGQAKLFVKDRILNNIVIIRINQTRTDAKTALDVRAELSQDFEAGSQLNNIQNYQLDIFGNTSSNPRALGTIFYHYSQEMLDSAITYVANLFKENVLEAKNTYKNDIYAKSPFNYKFDIIYSAVEQLDTSSFFIYENNTESSLFDVSDQYKKIFTTLVYMKLLESIYNTASQWPMVSWDEYYPDGFPITLNWELVVNNLARVFVKDLQKESESVQDASETAASLTWLNL